MEAGQPALLHQSSRGPLRAELATDDDKPDAIGEWAGFLASLRGCKEAYHRDKHIVVVTRPSGGTECTLPVCCLDSSLLLALTHQEKRVAESFPDSSVRGADGQKMKAEASSQRTCRESLQQQLL